RDLKPSNLMVNARGDLKVADFGIARSLNESVSVLTMQRGRSGTLLYMSPQQLEGERGSPLDDVYSLGATLYELLTSKPPFYFGNIDRQIREKAPVRMSERRRDLEVEGRPIDPAWEDVVRACLEKDPARRPQSVREVAERLAIGAPSSRAPATTTRVPAKNRAGLFAAIGIALALFAAAVWYFAVYKKGLTPAPAMTVQTPTQTETTPAAKERPAALVPPAPLPSASPIAPPAIAVAPEVREQTAPTDELRHSPAKPNVKANSSYVGTIHVPGDTSVAVPLAITIAADLKSGTMTQSGRRGDLVVRFAGIWDGPTLRGVTDHVVSAPPGIKWQPESFALDFADDANKATYKCSADGKNYLAEMALQTGVVTRVRAVYKGTIHAAGESSPGTPLTIAFAADRKSGTMTQTSKLGDTVVRFDGIWDDLVLRAVTKEVISKPRNIQWKPESFTIRLPDSGERASYECTSEGRLFTAELTTP
ncbi:MAG: eukaryotic-like serine/threonine-protein kinase, partial [Verrucomicrobiota bacterium]